MRSYKKALENAIGLGLFIVLLVVGLAALLLYILKNYWLYAVIIFGVLLLIFILYLILKNRVKKFEPIEFDLDISGKKEKSYDDYVDMYIINHPSVIDVCERRINDYEKYIFELKEKYARRKYRLSQVNKSYASLTDLITINIIRKQTRYTQQNYVRSSYVVRNKVNSIHINLVELKKVYNELGDYDFELTRSEAFSKNQRRLTTQELRERVKLRDNYTCQMCGKRMYDEVGLHIDHIIPISQGGKTVLSNLQVLCDKCNLKKGKK